MEQLTFELAPAGPPAFDNFVTGRNDELLARLRALAAGEVRETVVLLWGPPGSGRTHLVRSTIAAAEAGGRPVRFGLPGDAPDDPPGPGALVAVDDVDTADAEAQARLFTLFNRLAETGGQLLAAASSPPARLGLRDDLRTRLGWGLAYEVLPLSDADKPEALARHARDRGFKLSKEVIDYLLVHGRRDMPSLVATLAALDRHSLSTKRPITVPLLRAWLQQDPPLEP